MYFYIYDSLLTDKKHTRILSKIETRLASLDIAGKKHQLSVLRSVDEIIERILQKESPTIVVIGTDKTFCQAALPLAGQDAVLGFIPVQEDSLIARILGIPVNEYACDTISARGNINGQKFLSSLEFQPNKTILTADDKYEIIPKRIKTIKVINLDLLRFQDNVSDDSNKPRLASSPKDNQLEVLMGSPGKNIWPFKKREKQDSLFFVRKLKVKSKKSDKPLLIKVDKERTMKTPVIIEVDKKKVRLIVGKDRLI